MFNFNNKIKIEGINELKNYIKNNLLLKVIDFDKKKKKYFLNKNKILKIKKINKNDLKYFKYLQNHKNNRIYVNGLTNLIKKKWYKNKNCFREKNEKYLKSSKSFGLKIHREIHKYIKTQKNIKKLHPYTEGIIKHFKNYDEQILITELPIFSKNNNFINFASQIDLITINKDKNKTNILNGYELKTFFPSKKSINTFKNELKSIKDSKINRAYLQSFYNNFA